MKTQFSFKVLLFAIISISFFNCSKEEIIPEDLEVNNFVWGGMNAFYKYQGEVEALADTNFSTRNQLNTYLNMFELSSEELAALPDDVSREVIDFMTAERTLDSLLFEKDNQTDPLSFLVGNYEELINAFEGERKTTGRKVNQANGVFYVYDVVNGSPDAQSFTRGMEVDGTAPLDTSSDEFGIAENPVKVAKIINDDIGYLMYNNFTPAFNSELNEAFGMFREGGINHLIVDLRYNEGGSLETASYLASMITGQFTGEVFSRQIWNDKIMSNVLSENLTNFFTDNIDDGEINEAINSVNMDRVYFIVSDATSGPGEVLISSLKLKLNFEDSKQVILIGNSTKGFVIPSTSINSNTNKASLTLYDSDDYTRNGGDFNTSHTLALQPIVLEVQDVNGGIISGHEVNYRFLEDVNNLGVLGELSEPILAATVEFITTETEDFPTSNGNITTQIEGNSSMRFIDYNVMYVNLSN